MRCPICDQEIGSPSASRFPEFSCCPVCTGHFANGPATGSYGTEYFAEPGVPSLLARAFRPVLNMFLGLRLRRIRKALPRHGSAKILDYGAGAGSLVRALRERGYDAVGYEPSEAAVAFARRAGLPVSTEVPSGPFDLIMFWHSLEHVDDPLAVIRRTAALLKPSGRFLIAVPNAASGEATFARERWFHYDYPYHRIQFTPRAVGEMLGTAGFRIERADFFNPEYTVSGLMQTFINFFLPKNALYGALTHRRRGGMSRAFLMVAASLAAAVAVLPFLGVFFLAAFVAKKTGAMIVLAGRTDMAH